MRRSANRLPVKVQRPDVTRRSFTRAGWTCTTFACEWRMATSITISSLCEVQSVLRCSLRTYLNAKDEHEPHEWNCWPAWRKYKCTAVFYIFSHIFSFIVTCKKTNCHLYPSAYSLNSIICMYKIYLSAKPIFNVLNLEYGAISSTPQKSKTSSNLWNKKVNTENEIKF